MNSKYYHDRGSLCANPKKPLTEPEINEKEIKKLENQMKLIECKLNVLRKIN